MHPGPARLRWPPAAAVVAAIAVLLGIAGLVCAITGERSSDRLHEDEGDFIAAATQLRHHGILSFSAPAASPPAPSAYREPAYPALIAAAWTLAGFSPPTAPAAIARLPADPRAWRPVRRLNAMLLALCSAAVAFAVGRLGGAASGALAFAAVACSPALQANVPKAMAENLGAAHIALAGLCLLGLARGERGARLATLVVVGLLPLARAEGALLLPVALVVDGLAGRGRPTAARLRAGALLAIGLAAPSALWLARNAARCGHPVLADRSGLALAVRAELDADIERFGVRSALLAWTPLEVERRAERRSSPEPTWLEFRPLGPGNYYFTTLRRWQEARRRAGDSLAADAAFRSAAVARFVGHPWDHSRGAVAVAWRGLFAERSPEWARPFDFTFELGLLLAAAMAFLTTSALVRRRLPELAFLAPAWVLFGFHVAATELLPRYAVPLLPLAWGCLALAVAGRRAAPPPVPRAPAARSARAAC